TKEEILAKWAENAKGLDLLIGCTSEEARYCLSSWFGLNEKQAANFFKNSYRDTKSKADGKYIRITDAFIENCPLEKEWERIERMYTLVGYSIGVDAFAKACSENGNVWAYEFRLPAQNELAKSYHSSDVEYVFNRKDRLACFGYDDETIQKRCDEVQEVWVNFAKTGIPALKGVRFKSFDSQDRAYIVIDKEKGIYSDDHHLDEEVDALADALPISGICLSDSFGLNMDKCED
ncbi:MAG: carboxylesterase family protein, partial [Eubacterium sp.]|nr:carboxylesterase family protein [Eubacterium sp.]